MKNARLMYEALAQQFHIYSTDVSAIAVSMSWSHNVVFIEWILE
jgi:hypothetical protein